MKLPKDTKARDFAHGRWYGDACGTAYALEVIGERWALLVVRELMFGGRRFSDLRRSLPGISAKVLTERLEGLERMGVVRRVQAPPPAALRIYALTEWGRGVEPMLQELGRWAARSPGHDPTLPLSPVSLMLSLRTMIDHEAARRATARIGFAIGGEHFRAWLEKGELVIARGVDAQAEVRFAASEAPVLAVMFYGKVPMADLEASGGLMVAGDRTIAQRFIDLFALTPKIG